MAQLRHSILRFVHHCYRKAILLLRNHLWSNIPHHPQFRLPRYQNSSSNVYQIIISKTYHLLLFGGAHLQSIGELQVTLRILSDLSLYTLVNCLLRSAGGYLMCYLHVLDAKRNVVCWSLSIFLLDRLFASKSVRLRHTLVQSTIGCLLNLRTVPSVYKMSILGLRGSKWLISRWVIRNGI
jgi:hypothetical protein